MTTANPPAPSAQIVFFPRLHPLQPRQRTGRLSTWPFKVGRGDSHEKDGIRVQAARVIRTTAEHWLPSAS
jgi:hypothetical protein